ncbi:hypothetical protein [Algoriphagus confluentis]|uniref:Uncharacterized protein n=1 Tax=Algoriphagus confluentis TaxID=1697556 RepID=A0ABQ6PT90_9BACT|nr:hypothetical protein Aconfl_38580 [Algoriphagus confluentis]
MEIEMLKKLNEEFKNRWGPLTEKKINLIIEGIKTPKWDKILKFFNNNDLFDYSYIQSPNHALFIPKVIPNKEIGFYLYIHLEAPIFTCFFKKIHFGISPKNTRYTICSSSSERKFDFTLMEVIHYVKETYLGYRYLSHKLLFENKVDWGVPIGTNEKKDGYFIFEYFFEAFHFTEGDEMVVLE